MMNDANVPLKKRLGNLLTRFQLANAISEFRTPPENADLLRRVQEPGLVQSSEQTIRKLEYLLAKKDGLRQEA